MRIGIFRIVSALVLASAMSSLAALAGGGHNIDQTTGQTIAQTTDHDTKTELNASVRDAPAPSAECDTRALYGDGLLAPAFSPASTRALQQRLLAMANAPDCPDASLLAGVLYAQGDQHPAKLLARDLDQARALLLRALAGGRLDAMARLADVEIAARQFDQAMGWAQLNARYVQSALPNHTQGAASLILRVYANATDQSEAAAKRGVRAVVAEHQASIDQGFARHQALVDDAAVPAEIVDVQRPPYVQLRSIGEYQKYGATSMSYVLEIGADGRILRSWLLAAVPHAQFDSEVTTALAKMRFNPVPGAPRRYAEQPFDIGYQDLALDADAKSRISRAPGPDAGPR